MPDTLTTRRTIPGVPPALWRVLTLGCSRGIGIGAQMAVQIAVGAVAGPAAIGALQLQVAWCNVLGEVVAGGRPTRTLRDLAICHKQDDRRGGAALIATEARTILRCGALLLAAVLLLGTLGLTSGLARWSTSGAALLGAIVVSAPLFALTRLFAEAMKAVDRAQGAVTLENTVVPVVLLAVCGSCAIASATPSTALLLGGGVAGLALAATLLGWRLRQLLGKPESGGALTSGSEQQPAHVLRAQGELQHFWLGGLLNIGFLQLPFLLMPWMIDAQSTGYYAIAHKLINVITTLLILLAALYGPRFARAAADSDHVRLRGLLRETQLLSLALFIPAIALLLTFSAPLTTLFSLPAGALQPLLLLLAAGHLINAATGLSGVLLNMTGAPRRDLQILLGSCLFTVTLAALLGSRSGVEGIALAVTAGIALRNGGSYLAALLHLRQLERNSP